MDRMIRLVVAVAITMAPAIAAATAQRTFVASNGNDAAACSISAPCRSFAAAIAQTNAGGEIVVLDSAAYGRVTITKSVTITAPAGVHAGISVFAGQNGIDIPTSGIKVVLRGLSLTGQGGNSGIYISGDNEVTIERCDIGGMNGHGIHLDGVAGTVQIRDTVAHDNGGNGVTLAGQFLSATLDRVHIERNALAGMAVFDVEAVSLKDSALVRNQRGIDAVNATPGIVTSVAADGLHVTRSGLQGVRARAINGEIRLRLARGLIDFNAAEGVLVWAENGQIAAGIVSDNVIAGNGSGLVVDRNGAGAAVVTIAANRFAGPLTVRCLNGAALRTDTRNALEPDFSVCSPIADSY